MLVSERGRVVPCMQCRNFIFARKRCARILLHSARDASNPQMQSDRKWHFPPRKYSDTRDNLIQLADMVAGAIARSYRHSERKDAARWRQMLASKIEIIREFEG